ncbi:MAG: hypothetical protein SGILL_005391 [Bacillariaceae sp.]
MAIEVVHPSLANVSKNELSEILAKTFKADPKLVTVFGMSSKYGGGELLQFLFLFLRILSSTSIPIFNLTRNRSLPSIAIIPGKSSGFCVIYDNEESMIKFEPKYRIVRKGMTTRKEQSRKAMKEAKNKGKKVRGTGRRTAMHKAKRSAGDD